MIARSQHQEMKEVLEPSSVGKTDSNAYFVLIRASFPCSYNHCMCVGVAVSGHVDSPHRWGCSPEDTH